MTLPRDASLTGTSRQARPFSPKQTVLFIFGTRPEAIKLCPLITALRSVSSAVETCVCVTAQHREMLDQVLAVFDVKPDIDLDVMTERQTLPALTARLLSRLETVFEDVKPAMAVVQGDTATTFCGALSAFYARTPLAHVEAGLRTFDLQAPYPEEFNRVVTSRLARLHFAPTQGAADNLVREGIPEDQIEVTGNTGIDALLSVRDRLESGALPGWKRKLDRDKQLVVVTAHRRESFGEAFEGICRAVGEIAGRPDVQVVWPVHPNPQVTRVVEAILSGRDNVILTGPLPYVEFVDVLRRATVILTDSGGIQEEAPSLGKPVLVMREKTERPEGVTAGVLKLVGTRRQTILRKCNQVLDHPSDRQRMAAIRNPYGDGNASRRIAEAIVAYLESSLTVHDVR